METGIEEHLLAGAAIAIDRGQICSVARHDREPKAGDLICGRIEHLGEYEILEDREGRPIHTTVGTAGVFVLGNRYATDVFEGIVPEGHLPRQVHQLSRSGVAGLVRERNALAQEPTRILVDGYACDAEGRVINTRQHARSGHCSAGRGGGKAKMILCIGTSMSCGKSTSAAACCWALSESGHTVGAAKITGTASRRDVFLMRDSGASPVAEFSDLGYPSTHLLDEDDLLEIFHRLDEITANGDRDHWVAELADGVLQRETAMLLRSDAVRSRIHRLVFSASDACGAIGGLQVLRDQFGLVPDAVSGFCSSSPLGMRELRACTDLPTFNNVERDLDLIAELVI